jgi:hypothetical protein
MMAPSHPLITQGGVMRTEHHESTRLVNSVSVGDPTDGGAA